MRAAAFAVLAALTFTGERRGERIHGVFTCHGGDGHPTQNGRWRVRRVGAAVSGS
jgi:hypothetical protein